MSKTKREIELLAPAKNLEVGKIAILSGADAVYIGAQKYGAREAAGNSVDDIKELVDFAHLYSCKVFVTMNTILYESELQFANKLAWELYEIGVDALIIQDMAYLEMDMPPIPLHASTQMDNRDVEKVEFLEHCGLNRVVLARELSLDKIKAIRDKSQIELEAFVHGSLCVCFSGQCYLSYYIGGRSANRGACAQPCRMLWDLEDADGNKIIEQNHLLSLKDMNRLESLEEIVLSGVNSLKIEGRLKDADYVRNIVGLYRKQLDKIIAKHSELCAVGEGEAFDPVENDPEKSFNRGFTEFFLNAKREKIANFQSPKSLGKYIGKVVQKKANLFAIDTEVELANGDGLCFYSKTGELKGVRVNKVEDKWIQFPPRSCLFVGAEVYRNYDQKYQNDLKANPPTRKLKVCIQFIENNQNELAIQVKDAAGIVAIKNIEGPFELAKNSEMALANIKKQLGKVGDLPLKCSQVRYSPDKVYFFRMGDLNAWRREALELYLEKKLVSYKRKDIAITKNGTIWPGSKLDYHANISNSYSLAFWKRHKAEIDSMAFEMQHKEGDETLVNSKYCLKYQIGCCPQNKSSEKTYKEPLYLSNEHGRFKVMFDCKKCEMMLIAEGQK
ncbi:MAG: U32 family peptidase [Bacteroidales bacterium]